MKHTPCNLFLLTVSTFVAASFASAAITTPVVKNATGTDLADPAVSAWTFGGSPASAVPTSTDIVVLNGTSPTGTVDTPLTVTTGVTWKQLWFGQDGTTTPGGLSAPTAAVFVSGSKITLNNTADSAAPVDGYGLRNASHQNVTIGNDITFTGATRASISAEGNGNLTLNGAISFATATATAANALIFRNAGSSNIAGTTTPGTITINGNISATGNGNVYVTDSKTVVFSGNNTFGGTVTLASGTLLAGSDTAYGTGTISLIGGSIGSKDAIAHSFTNALSFGANATIGQTTGGTGPVSFSGAVALGSATRTITTHVNTTLSGAVTGSGGLTKAGTGTLMLNGPNTYIGNTLVSAGTLLVNGSLGTTAVTVGAAGTLGGTGSLGGTLNFDVGAKLNIVDIADALAISGSVTFDGFGFANITGWDYANAANGTYTLLAGSNFDLANVSNVGAANPFDLGGGRSAYFQNGSLQVVIIPEPTVALLGGLGMLTLLRRRRGV